MTSIHSLHAPGADLSPRAGSSQRSGHDPQVPQAPPGWPGFREAGAEEGTQGALGSHAPSQGGSTWAYSQGGSPAVSTHLVSPSSSGCWGLWTERL